jgi:N-acetylmuramoyl-L-alanine amidase
MKILEILLTLAFMEEVQIKTVPVKEIICLAQNVYHEARGEDIRGQKAVAHVTLNRVADDRWPQTICGVVYQPNQFSWTRKTPTVRDHVAYENSLTVALGALTGISSDPTDGAVYYYDHRRVTPRWSRAFETVAVIGGHTFKR